jgi:hypothetical protein
MLIFVIHEHTDRKMRREDSRAMDKCKCYITPVLDNFEWRKGPVYKVTVLPIKNYLIRLT